MPKTMRPASGKRSPDARKDIDVRYIPSSLSDGKASQPRQQLVEIHDNIRIRLPNHPVDIADTSYVFAQTQYII